MTWKGLFSRSLNLTISQRQKHARLNMSRSQETAFLSSNRKEGDISLRITAAIFSFIGSLAQVDETLN
jgi:hypothetical protein